MSMIEDRLDLVRDVMRLHNVEGFFLPHGEHYYGDYNACYVEGLRYLTGFDGSQGSLLLTLEHAYLFVDGRYTLQASGQVSGLPIECCDLSFESICEIILAESIESIGFDLRLFSESEWCLWERFGGEHGIRLYSFEDNPVDSAWDVEPVIPASVAHEHALIYAGVSSVDKRADLASRLKDMGAQASLISSADSIAWLLNIRGSDVEHYPVILSYGILCSDGRFLWFVDSVKVGDDLRSSLVDVEILPSQDLLEQLEGLKIDVIHLDSSSISADIFVRCRELGMDIRGGADLCSLPKACKNSVEVKNARIAHVWDGVAVSEFLHWFSVESVGGGLTELSASSELWKFRERNSSCRGMSFETISASGEHGAICHYRANESSNRRIGLGDIYLVDSGGQYYEGTTDITRTVLVGGDVSDEIRDRFTRVLQGHIALASVRFPHGISGSRLDGMARAPLWRVGLDFEHGTGHGVGSYLNVHEGPQNIGSGFNRTALREGMIISNEPGYYAEGRYGIRIENLVLVCDSGKVSDDGVVIYEFETLTLAPIDRRLIDKSMLNVDEIAWLDSYHRRVYESLSEHVSEGTREWLLSETSPL